MSSSLGPIGEETVVEKELGRTSEKADSEFLLSWKEVEVVEVKGGGKGEEEGEVKEGEGRDVDWRLLEKDGSAFGEIV